MSKRTSNYLDTLYPENLEEGLAVCREIVRDMNANRWQVKLPVWASSVRYALAVRPRLGRHNPNAHLYAKGGPLHRWSGQTIKREHGQRFDVYVHMKFKTKI